MGADLAILLAGTALWLAVVETGLERPDRRCRRWHGNGWAAEDPRLECTFPKTCRRKPSSNSTRADLRMSLPICAYP